MANGIKNNQKGATAILLTVLILSVLLVIGMGVSTLVLNQIKTMRTVGFSVEALYAADAGAETCLYQVRKETAQGCDGSGSTADVLDNNATFAAEKTIDTIPDPDIHYIRSLGQFQTTSRKIELSWQE